VDEAMGDTEVEEDEEPGEAKAPRHLKSVKTKG
jgi:hypothetical protein